MGTEVTNTSDPSFRPRQQQHAGAGRSLKGQQMQVEQILIELDREIARLQEARALLSGTSNGKYTALAAKVKRKPGRPAGAAKLSPEARQHIADAMKRSWALRKKKQAVTPKAAKKK